MILLSILVASAQAPAAQPQSKPPFAGHPVPSAPAKTTPPVASPATGAAVQAEETKPVPPPYAGSLHQGFDEIRKFADAHDADAAAYVADRMLAPTTAARWREDWIAQGGWRASFANACDPILALGGWGGPPPALRAEVDFAKGVALDECAASGAEGTHAALRARAGSAFEAAELMAGPGDLRLDAAYDDGSIAFEDGEEQRAKIPEISGQKAQPQPPAAAGPDAPKAPDPLQLARAAYVRARKHFVERLKIDWRDADTQADVELVQRRLHELDKIEEQRKQQQQDSKDKDQQKKDDQQKQDDKSSKDKQDQKDKDSKDQDKKKDADKDKDPPPDGKQKPDEEKKPPEQQKPEDAQKDADKKDESKDKPEPKPGEEQKLSKEEVMQILERLQQIEDQGKKLQEQLRQMRRVKVKKDW